MKIYGLLDSNLDYWFNLRGTEIEIKYRGIPNPIFKYPRVRRKFGKYLCFFHSHSDHYTLEQIAERASSVGYTIGGVTDHLAPYKKSEDKFGDVRLKYFDNFGRGREVYFIRGVECHCIDKGDEIKLLLLGYRNPAKNEKPIEPGLSLEETIERAKALNALIITASTFNKYSKGIDESRLLRHLNDFDAIGILDSAVGMFGIPFHRLNIGDMRAYKFSKKFNKAGIYELNSHNLEEMGVSGTYIDKADLPCLADPKQVMANPDLLTNQIRAVLRRGYGAIENTGGYFPAISPLFNRRRGEVIIKDMREANLRYLINALRFIRDFFSRNGHDKP